MNELRIIPPEGMEIDKENSTFEVIKFKPKRIYSTRNIKGKYYLQTEKCFNTLEDLDWVKAAYMLRTLWREWIKNDSFDNGYYTLSICNHSWCIKHYCEKPKYIKSFMFQHKETAEAFIYYNKEALNLFYSNVCIF